MLCGRWESYPREFAKCRRCRKAKYCGKECQSTAWSEGHRFWCSAKDGDDETAELADQHAGTINSETTLTSEANDAATEVMVTAGGTITGRSERRAERERERHARERALATAAAGGEAQVTRMRNVNSTAALGQSAPRSTGMSASRPLLAPPTPLWADRPAQPYSRPANAAVIDGSVPPVPRAPFNPYHPMRQPALDDEFSLGRRRADTVVGLATGPHTDIPQTSRYPLISMDNTRRDGFSPPGGRRREDDHDMSLD